MLVKDIYPGSNGSNPQNLTNVNGTLYFAATDGTNGLELWKSDGTAAGTVLVKDIYPGSNGSNPQNLTNVNGTLYFAATDGTNGLELWKSDGTAAGTVLVEDIYVGNNGSSPQNLTNLNGTLYFSASEGTNGLELWKSDGTAAGTVLVKDIYTGSTSSFPQNLTNVNGTLYFAATDVTNGQELWKSDGTAAGTVLVKDIYAGSTSSSPSNLTIISGTFYFSATDATNGRELWKSDGTVSGTVLIKDINTGSSASFPQNLTNINGTVFLRATDATSGTELWKSDGTAAGTVLVKDIYAGGNGSSIQFLTDVNGKLYFTASGINSNGFVAGIELWSLGGCSPSNAKVTDVTGASGGVVFNMEQQATPATLNCGCDILNNLIASVNAQGVSPVSGNILSRVWIDGVQSATQVKRHYELNAVANPSTSTGKITLYFTQQEFTDYNGAGTVVPLPTGPADATGIGNLRIIQRTGTGDENGLASSYGGTPLTIDPSDTDIVWNATDSRWEVAFSATGFGGFWATSDAGTLPLSWIKTGTKLTTAKTAVITWKVAEYDVAQYEVERSADGDTFEFVAAKKSQGSGTNNYELTDYSPFLAGNLTSYYRIKQIDKDGVSTYSDLMFVKDNSVLELKVYPNPFTTEFTIVSHINQDAEIVDVSGRLVQKLRLTKGTNVINGSAWAEGLYLLKVETATIKLIKTAEN